MAAELEPAGLFVEEAARGGREARAPAQAAREAEPVVVNSSGNPPLAEQEGPEIGRRAPHQRAGG